MVVQGAVPYVVPAMDELVVPLYSPYHQFELTKFYFLPAQCICVLPGSQNKRWLFLHNINRLVFITEAECVYWAVRTVSLCIIQIKCSFKKCDSVTWWIRRRTSDPKIAISSPVTVENVLIVPLLRRLVAGLTPQRPGFRAVSFRVRFVVDSLAMDWFVSQYFGFALSASFNKCCALIFINMFFLPEGQTGEAWEPSRHPHSF